MIKLKNLLIERFDSVEKFLLNSEYVDKPYSELIDDFKRDGGEILGQGKQGMVYYHPSWKYVLKTFFNDIPYLKFVRFSLKNPRVSFPKLLDKPRKILPYFLRTRENEFLYVVKLEKLSPITRDEFKDINYYLYYGPSETVQSSGDMWEYIKSTVERIESQYPSIKQFKLDYEFLRDSSYKLNFGTEDFHQQNIMKRDSGQFVLADPFWVGESPYQTHDRLMKSEIGYDDEDEKSINYIKGGEKYKKQVIKPEKTTQSDSTSDSDEIPF